jgi:hypothetical protein
MNIDYDLLTKLGLLVTGALEAAKPWLRRYVKDDDLFKIVVMMAALVISMGVAVVNAESAKMLLQPYRATFTFSPELWDILDTIFFGFLIFTFNIFGHKIINVMNWFDRPKPAPAPPVAISTPSTTVITGETTVAQPEKPIFVDDDPMAQG